MNFPDLYERYSAALAEKEYAPDSAQLKGVSYLQPLVEALASYSSKKDSSFLSRIFSSAATPEPPRGVYLYGGVGRGKSFLMDIFFDAAPITRKVRLHFHEFMQSIHASLRQEKGVANPLEQVAIKVAQKYQLICFDEFHISDIADAMILYQLLDYLWKNRVVFVMTSNYEPSTLYPDGLHRNRLLPAIELIYQHMHVVELDAQVDYRQLKGDKVPYYVYPLSDVNAQKVQHVFFEKVQGHEVESPAAITIQGRTVYALHKSQGVVWFSFAEICQGAYSQIDYLEMAKIFHTFIVTDIPRLSAADASAARRFTWLIDVLYDHHRTLICSAACAMDDLYKEGLFAQEFVRTLSRLEEMQSDSYHQLEQRVVVEL